MVSGATSSAAPVPSSSTSTQTSPLSTDRPASTNPVDSVAAKEPWSVQSALLNVSNPPPSSPNSPIPFLHLLERLKTTPREGWRRFHIPNGESISDHMYRMSILTMLAPLSLSKELDVNRCTKMALVHDMAEALVGDITPKDGVDKSEKTRRESETMDFLTKELLGRVGNGGAEAGCGLREVWQEYEDNKTLEAKFVHDVDKLELVLQMMEYERRAGGSLDLGEFSWVAEKIVLKEVRQWCAEVLMEREIFWKGLGSNLDHPVKGLQVGRGIIEMAQAERMSQNGDDGQTR